jgi:hypothetical protein
MLASTMSNGPSISSIGVFDTDTLASTPLRSALAVVTATDAGEMSIAWANEAPNAQAATESTPEPQPTSSTVAPGKMLARSARMVSSVVGWSPRPNVAPGSMNRAVTPAGTAISIQAGQTTRSAATHVAPACARQVSATDSSTSTSRQRHRAGNASAASTTAAASSPSDVHSSTK